MEDLKKGFEPFQMEQEQADEICQLRDAILANLRHHSFIDGGQHVFQYLVIPSFSPTVSFDVFKRCMNASNNDFVLTKTVWRSDLDLAKLSSPVERLRHPRPLQPTIEIHVLSVPSETLENLFKELSNLKQSVATCQSQLVLDGVGYEIALEQTVKSGMSSNDRLSWNEPPPSEWQDIPSWAKKAEAIFDMAQHTKAAIPFRIMPLDNEK